MSAFPHIGTRRQILSLQHIVDVKIGICFKNVDIGQSLVYSTVCLDAKLVQNLRNK